MKKVLKFVSLALCIAMFCGIFAACGQTEEPSQTAAGGEEVSDAPDDGSSYVFTVATRAAEGDLVLTMGGGDIYKCARMIVERLKRREN